MRRSPQRHTLAVLRGIIGLSQKQMAALVGRATVTIQKIELGKLDLGEELAHEIVRQTGVDLKWLRDNDVSKEPTEWREGDAPYDKLSFEENRAALHRPLDVGDRDWARWVVVNHLANFAGIAVSAMRGRKFELFTYKVRAAMDRLEKEFGLVKSPFFDKKDQCITSDDFVKTASAIYERDAREMLDMLYPALDQALASRSKPQSGAEEGKKGATPKSSKGRKR